MTWLDKIMDAPHILFVDDYERMARVIREFEGIGKAAQDLINSLREPPEPTNLRKSPVAAWMFAEELRTKLDKLSPDAKEIINDPTAPSST